MAFGMFLKLPFSSSLTGTKPVPRRCFQARRLQSLYRKGVLSAERSSGEGVPKGPAPNPSLPQPSLPSIIHGDGEWDTHRASDINDTVWSSPPPILTHCGGVSQDPQVDVHLASSPVPAQEKNQGLCGGRSPGFPPTSVSQKCDV